MSNILTLAFEADITVHQTIKITAGDLDKQSLIQGLRDGHITTTMWHEQGEAKTQDTPCYELIDSRRDEGCQVVGYVYSQTVDGEFKNFR